MDVDLENPAEAEALVGRLFGGETGLWQHIRGVATRAEQLGSAVSTADRSLLHAAGWLHDIGYADQLHVTGFHPLDGANYLRSLGFDRLAALVAHHSGARYVAYARGLAGALAEYAFEEDPLTDALTAADQAVGPRGERLTIEQRMTDMLTRHGPHSPNALVHHLRAPYLKAAVQRTERRQTVG